MPYYKTVRHSEVTFLGPNEDRLMIGTLLVRYSEIPGFLMITDRDLVK